MTKYKQTKEIKLNACPRCGETALEMHFFGAYHKWSVICLECGLSSRLYKRLDYAIHDWNEKVKEEMTANEDNNNTNTRNTLQGG